MVNGYFLAVGIPIRRWILFVSLSDKISHTNAGAF